MSAQSIVNWFSKMYKGVGMEGFSSNSGRKTFATRTVIEMYKTGGSLQELRKMLKHSSAQTTKQYIQQGSQPDGKLQKMIDMLDQPQLPKNNSQ